MSGKDLSETEPSAEHCARYAELLETYRELYGSLRGTFAKLADFRAGASHTEK
jgi:hypothetical protein